VQAFQLLREMHKLAVREAAHLRFDKRNERDRNLVAVYCSLIELTSGIIVLISQRASACVPIAFRSLLEAFVDFQNLVKDPNYSQHLQAAHISEWLRLQGAATGGENPYLASLADLPELSADQQRNRETLAELASRGYKALSHFERFVRAGMEHEYRSIYNMVCSYSHNNLRALIDRHIEMSGDDFELVLFKREGPSELVMYVDSSLGLLLRASETMHEIYGRKGGEPFRQADERLLRLRNALVGSDSDLSKGAALACD